MAGLLRYFKHTQKRDKLAIDTSTPPDPDVPLSRVIPFFSIGITNIYVHQVQQEASSKRRSRGPYISLTPTQKYSIGIVDSYSFRHAAGLLIHQYFTC